MMKKPFASALAGCCAVLAVTLAVSGGAANASDHLDSPTVIADPRADIGDVFAWISPDGRKVNLAMTIVGNSFSEKLDYIFHIDSGARFGRTKASVDLACRFANATSADCRLGRVDRAEGDASRPEGISSTAHKFRLFAGQRDEPFFNNVRGSRAAYDAATKALTAGATYDAAGCPGFSPAASSEILDRWKHSDGGPATNFLRGWAPASIVVSVDIAPVSKGGPLLAVWAETIGPKGPIDRAARPLTGNALLVTLGDGAVRNAMKERYNRTAPAKGGEFTAAIATGVALYDGFDGQCGDSLLIDRKAPPARRYWPLAAILADDRLWVNSRAPACTQLFAVERAALNGEAALAGDCGGRTPNYDAVNVYRSLLANGTTSGIDDGVHADEKIHSVSDFPFLAAPDPGAATP